MRDLGSAQPRDVEYFEFAGTSPYVPSENAHADLGLMVPAANAARFLDETLPRLTEAELGGAMALRVFLWKRDVFTRRLFRTPRR